VPDGYRDDDGVWWAGPHRQSFDALLYYLDRLEAVAEAAREDVELGWASGVLRKAVEALDDGGAA
jgi:hypothetical protein